MSGKYGESVRPSILVAKVPAHAHAHVEMEEHPELIGIALDLLTKQWLVIQFRAMVLLSFLSFFWNFFLKTCIFTPPQKKIATFPVISHIHVYILFYYFGHRFFPLPLHFFL